MSGPKSNFVIWHNFTCTAWFYCISCSKCCKLYISEWNWPASIWQICWTQLSRKKTMMLTNSPLDISIISTIRFPIWKFVQSRLLMVVMVAAKHRKSVSIANTDQVSDETQSADPQHWPLIRSERDVFQQLTYQNIYRLIRISPAHDMSTWLATRHKTWSELMQS